jgi:hypothetical protein
MVSGRLVRVKVVIDPTKFDKLPFLYVINQSLPPLFMKKANWLRLFLFLLVTGMFLIQACGAIRPKCNCPHW